VEVLGVYDRANGDIGKLAKDVLDLDLDAQITGVLVPAQAARCRVDHPFGSDRAQRLSPGRGLVERTLDELGMQRALHADRIAAEPSLEVVENSSFDRGPLTLWIPASHDETITAPAMRSAVDRGPDRQSRIVTLNVEPNR
jgi:hypothetical protein